MVFGPNPHTFVSWLKRTGTDSSNMIWANDRNTLRLKNYDLMILYYIGSGTQLRIFHRLKAYGKDVDPDMKVTLIQ